MTVSTVRSQEKTGSARHPLAPLTVAEAGTASRVALDASGPGSRLVYCALDEPDKAAVRGLDDGGQPIARQALCVVYERPKGLTWLVTVVLDEQARVTSAVPVPGVQPLVTGDQFVADSERIKQAPAFQAALARRGLTDMSAIAVDAWPAAYFGLDVDKSGRPLARAVAYALDGPNPNPYARPIENLVVIWDRDAGEIVELQDGDPVPLPTDPGRYDAAGTEPHRELAELRILQPDGPGFTVDDGQLRWGPWQLRVSLHPVEGLVLHEVTYIEGERARPILFRASMSEMVVPYGSTAMNHWWKNAFDAGECGLGLCASSLELGCDCLGEIVYLDGVQVDAAGAATPLRNAICLHEEDYGMLWKHVDARHRVSETRRSRRMVVSSISTVGNYEYGFFWYFYLDGTIQAEVKLTGIIQTQAVRPGERVPYANPVTPELAGPHHQHVFSYRLDFTLDGAANAVYEVDAVPVPTGPDNPHGNAFTAQATLLESELQAQRLAAADKSRYWKIVNHGVRNAVDEPVAYKLVPAHATAPLLAQPDAAITSRAAFGTKHLWVTPFAADERRAAGDFPNQHPGGDGLPRWTAADRPVVDTDIVVWHTVGVTHFCRPEDFPVMPVEYTGFTLKPFGFFDRNPAIDLAPSASAGGRPLPPVTPDPVTLPTAPGLLEIVQVKRPQDMTPEATRELVNCWMIVANSGGAVGFPFPPVGADDVQPVADQLIADLDPEYNQILLARFDGVLAGWLSLSRHRDRVVPHWGVVKRVQTHPDFRGRGIGAALMHRVREVARDELGLEQLRLEARGGAGLEGFYGRLGWREIGRWPDALRFDHGDRDEVLMLLAPL